MPTNTTWIKEACMNKFISCCLLIVLLSTVLSFTFLPVSASGPEGDINITRPSAKFDTDWNIEGYGTDARGFSFQISISDPIKYYVLNDDGSIESVKDLGLDTGSKFEIGETSLYLHSPYIRITISSKYSPQHDFLKWTEYPNAPGMPETVFSLLLNEETQDAILSGLDSLAANVKTEADAEALLPILVQYLSASLDDIAPAKEPTPAWVIGLAIGGGAAIVAIPTVSLLLIKRKRQREAT